MPTLNLSEIKTGRTILWRGEPYKVMDYQHAFLGRGGAVLRSKLKNLLTGGIVDYTFQDKDKVEDAEVTRHKAQYLYAETEGYAFMDNETFEQFTLSKDIVGERSVYLVEGVEVSVIVYNGNALDMELPVKVTLTVVEAPPSIKGDTAGGGDKVCVLETGMTLTTPLFINVGDRLVINTERGTYVGRE
jgi:elongation factor P